MSISHIIHRQFQSKAQLVAILLVSWVILLICIVNLGYEKKVVKPPVNNFQISALISEVRIQSDGDIFVTEYVFFNSSKDVPFKPFSRILPLTYNLRDKGIFKLDIEQLDNFLYSNNKEVKVDKFKAAQKTPNHFIMQVGTNAALPDGSYYYLYQYRIKDLANVLKENGRLKWNVSGIWQYPLNQFETHIIFPDGVSSGKVSAKIDRFQRQIGEAKSYKDVLIQESQLEIKDSSQAEDKVDRDQKRAFTKFTLPQPLAAFDFLQFSIELNNP